MTNYDDEEPPQKRRMIENGDEEALLRALLLEEIDLEIGLRTRLKEIVESRLTWAFVLEHTLERQLESSEVDYEKTRDSPNHYADLAIAAYNATRDSSGLFLLGQDQEPPCLTESQASVVRQPEPCNPPVKETPRNRHWARPHVQLHHEDRAVKQPNKFLFIRDTTATPTMVYKIACPDCGRSDFPRLQGLLNHCRLKHHREFGSHDECVQACAVVVPEGEQDFVIKHGLEVTAMSASLQRLFKMAVGSYDGVIAVPSSEEMDELANVAKSRPQTKTEETEKDASTLVTKTLGHHKDTPALAPFLGRAPKKRQIHEFDDGSPLDVVSIGENEDSTKRNWKTAYSRRSGVGEEVEGLAPSDEENVLDTTESTGISLGAREGSRFHIPVRLIISDHSLRLPGEVAKKQGGTHRWMISISTASYSLHVSTVLVKATVTSATETPPSMHETPLSATEPPFCIMGITDKPFLARIKLEWAAASRNKSAQIDHWVKLEVGRSTRPVKGDDQVVDIELDRHTELLPRKGDTWNIDWFAGIDSVPTLADQKGKKSGLSGTAQPDQIKRLRALIQQFPMTAQDTEARKFPQVPYFLPLTLQHFECLVEGRQKAIEWARARALYEAYVDSRSEGTARQGDDNTGSIEKFSGPMAVYRWMVAEGYFPRAPSRSLATAKIQAGPDSFCAFCGFKLSVHRKGKPERIKDGEGVSMRGCEFPSWASRMPIVDAQDFCARQPPAVKRRVHPEWLSEDAHNRLLQSIDPMLIVGVQRTASALHLSCFSVPLNSPVRGAVLTREQRERELVPYAILAASVRALIRFLINGSLQSMDTKVEGTGKPAVAATLGPRKRLLVPGHVVRGLVEGTKRKGSKEIHWALLLSMARLGVAVEDVPSLSAPQTTDGATDADNIHTLETK